MKKKGLATEMTVVMIILAVVAVVLIYSLRVIPQEVQRQQSCEAHAGFCADEPTCPSGTQRIDYDCADNRPCCIGIVEGEREEEESTSDASRRAEDRRPAEEEREERRSIAGIQERLTAAREEGDLVRISTEYDAAKELIIGRFAQYRPPTNRPMNRETTPFDYNTVKSFEQLTLAAEAAFRIANDEKKRYAASQNYFNWMCKSWVLLLRAHLLGYYDESTYGLDNWLVNKERVFRDYGEYIGSDSPTCDTIRSITRATDFTACKELWSDQNVRTRALAQDSPTEDVWGACFEFRQIIGPYHPVINFEQDNFRITNFIYPESLETIFGENES